MLLNANDWVKELDDILAERKRLMTFLDESPVVESVFPSETNFVLFRVQNASELYNFLTERGIVVRNRSTQFNCENTLRISVGTSAENNLFMNALNNYQL